MLVRIDPSRVILLDGGAQRREHVARGAPDVGVFDGERVAVVDPPPRPPGVVSKLDGGALGYHALNEAISAWYDGAGLSRPSRRGPRGAPIAAVFGADGQQAG